MVDSKFVFMSCFLCLFFKLERLPFLMNCVIVCVLWFERFLTAETLEYKELIAAAN